MKKEVKRTEFNQIIPTRKIIGILNRINRYEEDMYIALDASTRSEAMIFNSSELFDFFHGGFNYTISEVFDIELSSTSTISEGRYEGLKNAQPLVKLFTDRYEKIKNEVIKLNKEINVKEIKEINKVAKIFNTKITDFIKLNK